ncbi:FAD-binding oxidoreductase [Leifsonia sp. fls2-241-R2A-40a]|uniref:NAD(P)/FAD-dependent oxidoreductase n=1 Tax=Leifsonia sp. fls2-241-R2A-40a TaxID=3040290 RepID=UPI00254D24E2|nr:FAD-binding oxidoreductase [Leifsonia sp. fls2-241-R2A-40a]
MTTPSIRSRVVVIGGGILGVSTAVHLVRSGADVTLLTEGELASGASGRSLSWLNTAGLRSPEYHALRQLGIDRYRTLAARSDVSAFLRFDGGLTWAPDGESFASILDHERSIGYDAQWVTASNVAEWTPGVDPAALAAEGAIFNPGEGWVDLPSLIAFLAAEFTARGGRLVTGAGRAVVLVEDGRAVGALTADGRRFGGDAVLLATGPDVPAQVAEHGITIEDGSPTALLVWTKPVETELKAVLNTPNVAVRPTPSGALALDSAWSEEALIVGDDGSVTVPDGVVDRLLEEASRVLAGNPALALDGFGIGGKPIPGDGDPVLGELEQLSGYFVAFTHSGATLGLIAGELLAREILTGEKSPLLDTFRPARFSGALV